MMKFLAAATIAAMCWPFPAAAQKPSCAGSCQDGTTLYADPSYEWDSGIYDITVQADNRTLSCRGTLPLTSCGDRDEQTFRCNSENIVITERGCGLPIRRQAIASIFIKGISRRVNVTITRSGKPFLSRTLIPHYDSVKNPSPDCRFSCKAASYNLLKAE